MRDREQFRDDLIAWLAMRNLHLGGDFPIAIVYAPENEAWVHSWRTLRRWLSSRLDRTHRLEVVAAASKLPIEQRRAAVEAIACVHMALAEASVACNLDLQRLAATLRSCGKAGRQLAASPTQQ
jgi:hypothetical protein